MNIYLLSVHEGTMNNGTRWPEAAFSTRERAEAHVQAMADESAADSERESREITWTEPDRTGESTSASDEDEVFYVIEEMEVDA